MEENTRAGKVFHELFEVSVILKGMYGCIEVALGFIIVFVNRRFVSNFLVYLFQGVDEEPRGLAGHVYNFSHHISASTELFTGIYFLVYGVIKLVLVYGLLKEELWAFPAALFFMTAFMGYEIFRVSHTHSLILAGIIVIDIATIYLVWREWRVREDLPTV